MSAANARGWFYNIAMHDVAEKMELSRIAAAQAYGLPAGDHVTKFAGQSTTTNNYGGGIVKGALVTLLSGLAFGGLGLAAAQWMMRDKPVEAVPPIVKPTEIDGGSFDITIEAIDGKLVPTEIKRVEE